MLGDQHLLAQRLGEAAHGELGGVIGALAGHGDQPEHARDVDDVAVAGRDHMRQKGFRPVHDAPEVDVDDPLDVLELGLLDVAVVGDAGVVVDLVDFAEVCDDRVGVGQHGLAFGDVEAVGLHLRAECFGLARGLGKSFGVDVGEGKVRALLREIEGKGPADAGAGSGDDGDFAFESSSFDCDLSLEVRIFGG